MRPGLKPHSIFIFVLPRSLVRRSPKAIGSGVSGAPQLAYAGNVVSFPLRRTFPAMNAVLVVALLLTQAASTVCTAQCVQRLLPESSPHCHSMLHVCPHPNRAPVVSAGACGSSSCGMDLLAGNQDRSRAQHRPPALNTISNVLSIRSGDAFPQASASLRSSVGGPPVITALRV